MKTAHEIDRLGGKGLKVTRGTVSQVDRDGKFDQDRRWHRAKL